MPTITARPLVIDRFSPGWVRRARRVLREELHVDITRMRPQEWIPVLCAALDYRKDVDFAGHVLRAARIAIDARYCDMH